MFEAFEEGGISNLVAKIKAWANATFSKTDTITSVKGNAETDYRTGDVNLTPANIGAVDKTGDTMTGALTLANGTLNSIGDDCSFGDQNVGGTVCFKGLNGNTRIRFLPYSGTVSHDIYTNGTGTMTLTGAVGFENRVSTVRNLTFIGTNPTGGTANDTRAWWAERSPCIAWFSATGQLNGQPSQYGLLISLSNGGQEVHQEWWTQSNGLHFRRGGNGSTTAMPGWTNIDGSSCVPKPTQLYYNATGTNGTVTLSASAANYNHMSIYTRTGDNFYAETKVYSPNGKRVSLLNIWTGSGASASTALNKAVTVSGTSITVYGYGNFNNNGSSTTNSVYIIRVEAWNE